MRHKGVTHSGDSRRPLSVGPREAETLPTLNLTHISHSACLHLHSFQDYHPHPNWLISPWCLHEWRAECPSICSFGQHVIYKESGQKPMKDVTHHKKKRNSYSIIWKCSWYTVLATSPVLLYRDASVGLQYDSVAEHAAYMKHTGGLISNTIHQHYSSTNNSVSQKQNEETSVLPMIHLNGILMQLIPHKYLGWSLFH